MSGTTENKMNIAISVLRFIIGKNSFHIARKIQTFLGGLLMSSVLFTGEIDPSLAENAGHFIEPVTQAEIKDGLTLGEVMRVVAGFALWWGSRIISYFRARNRDVVAKFAGIIIGRSIHSLYRSLMTLAASALTFLGISGTGDGLLETPLVTIIGAALLLAGNGLSSFFQDSKPNPVESSPDGAKLVIA